MFTEFVAEAYTYTYLLGNVLGNNNLYIHLGLCDGYIYIEVPCKITFYNNLVK